MARNVAYAVVDKPWVMVPRLRRARRLRRHRRIADDVALIRFWEDITQVKRDKRFHEHLSDV